MPVMVKAMVVMVAPRGGLVIASQRCMCSETRTSYDMLLTDPTVGVGVGGGRLGDETRNQRKTMPPMNIC
jgi:hypothetical protein